MNIDIPKKDLEDINELANAFFKELPLIAEKLAKVQSIPLGIMQIRDYFIQAYGIGKESGLGIKKELITHN